MTRPRFGWKPLVTTLRNPKSRFLHSLLILLTSGAVILSLVGFFLYREQALPPRQPFTEFAVLDGSGSTKNYITNLTVGTPVQYTVFITNRGNTSAEYRLQVWLSERLQDEQVPFVLSAGERWEHPVIWTPSQPAQRTWLEFKLVASDQRIPVYKVGLWVTVRE